MPVDKRVVMGGAAALLLGVVAFASAGESEPAEAPKPKPRRPLTDKDRAVAYAVKYARLFGVPASLVLAVMAVNGWKPGIHIPNSRGGAWGIMTMTLATAKDLTSRFPGVAKTAWPRFNGQGESLRDLETNVALGAYHMSLQWKKWKRWSVAALSYYTGAGRMAVIVKPTGGKLPAKLPADAAKEWSAFARVKNSDPIVVRAVAREGAASLTGGDPLIWTSTLVRAEMDRIRIVLDAINNDVSAAAKTGAVTHEEWENWYDFYKKSHEFVSADQGGWGGAVEQARNFEQTAAGWRDLVRSRGGKTSGPNQARAADKPVTDWNFVVKAGIGVGALIGGAALLNAIKH
jgi:hypothetical protein